MNTVNSLKFLFRVQRRTITYSKTALVVLHFQAVGLFIIVDRVDKAVQVTPIPRRLQSRLIMPRFQRSFSVMHADIVIVIGGSRHDSSGQ